jgi:hypothetical protein
MDEFVQLTQQRAMERLQEISGQRPTAEMNPILELVTFLLEDGAGEILAPPRVLINNDDWQHWNQLMLEQQAELVQAMNAVLARDQIHLPAEPEATRSWAATLLLSTLDQFEMM